MTDLVAIRRPREGLQRLPRPHLRDLDRDALGTWVAEHVGGPRYRAQQIFEWLHRHRVQRFEDMTNLDRSTRDRLQEIATIEPLGVDLVQRATDGTLKLRARTLDGHAIECVLIPNEGRGYTLCVSSMVGCSLTCRFCATATLGFTRNLSTWEIVDQVYRAQDLLRDEASRTGSEFVPRLTNLVMMGMGEPLHNFNQVRRALEILTDEAGAGIAGRRITVSTAGLVPGIERFAREGLSTEVGLAISLNATTDAVRDRIMPINTRWNIATLLDTVRKIPTPRRRQITFEYVLLHEVNDTEADVDRLAALLAGLPAKVNAIPFNPHPGAPFGRPTPERIEAFVNRARARGLEIHVRAPRGDDIAAACGQLALQSA